MRKNFAALKLRVGRLAGAVDNDSLARAGECVNDALDHIKRERPWSFLRGVEQTIALTAGEDTYDTPTGMMNVQRVYYKDTDSTLIMLRRVSDAEFLRDWQGVDTDEPIVYRVLGMDTTNYQSRIQVAHPPSASFVATYGSNLYVEQTDDLSTLVDDTDYPDLPGDFTQAIEYMAASMLCLQQGDQAQGAAFLSAYGLTMRVLKAADATRLNDLLPLQPTLGASPNASRRKRFRDYSRRLSI